MKTTKPGMAPLDELRAVTDDLSHEASTASLVGDADSAKFLTGLARSVSGAMDKYSAGKATTVSLFSQLNSIARRTERLALESESDQCVMMLRVAYRVRVATERAASRHLCALGSGFPKFEGSVAELRLTCAALAHRLGLREETIEHAEGVFRLAAPDTLVSKAREFMQMLGSEK
ncbi:MAG: hypothetical protein JSS66_06045 [Armatimonadetes bacterium]|nr:hypothetical protein [Armatimonadota bacterium]